MKHELDYDYFQEGYRFRHCEIPKMERYTVEPTTHVDDSHSLITTEIGQIVGLRCEPYDEFDAEMNLSSFILLLENLFDKLPEIVHTDYAQVVHFCKCFDVQEMERSWGAFSFIADNTPIDKSSSVLNTLCRVFYCGMDFLPMSIFDDNMRIVSLPFGLVDCIFADLNPTYDLFKALELLHDVRCKYAIERRMWINDISTDSLWCKRSTLTGELLDNDVYGEDD